MDISTGWLKSDIHTWIYPWISNYPYPRQAWNKDYHRVSAGQLTFPSHRKF